MFNAMVVSGGGFQGLSVIKGLRYSNRVRIVLVDSSPENISRYFSDASHTVPKVVNEQQFIDSLLDICVRENVRILFPSTNIELPLLSKNKDLFRSKGIYCAVSDPPLLDTIMNKRSLYDFLADKDLPVLPIIDIAEPVKAPLIGKPLSSWGGKGIIVLHSPGDRNKWDLEDLKASYVWQPFLEDFEEFSVDCAIDFSGMLSDMSIRRRVKTLGGFAAITKSAQDDRIQDIVTSLMDTFRHHGAQGIFNVQILKNGGNYYLSDVNPRIGTSAVFSYHAGINFPLFMCSSLDSSIPASGNTEPLKTGNTKMVRYLDELWIEQRTDENIRALIFDLDDTLINQKRWIFDKLSLLWPIFSDKLPSKQTFIMKAIQIIEEGNRSHLFDALADEFLFGQTLKDILIDTYRGLVPENCPLYPDVIPSLTALRQASFRLALLTDNPPGSQKQKVKTCAFDSLFDVIIYTRELDCEKPHSSTFHEATNRLDVPVEETAMVGDNLYKDIIGSLDAGYALAYWIRREGTFFNFEKDLLRQLNVNTGNFVSITSIREVVWSLVP